jgi:outer membrane lipoprotein
MRRALVFALTLMGLAGCGSVFSDGMLRGVDRSLTLGVLRSDPARYLQARVVLAGEVIETRPKSGSTEIEVLARPLGDGDAPRRTDESEGRFLLVAPDFLDPAVYARGRRLSAVGTVTASEDRALGERPYRYVVIRVDQIYLWAADYYAGYPPPPYYGRLPYFW